jgi:2-(1,2-epoxy-1,2-dihydrophenyl)acetyl-CoA isomerase
MRIGRIVLERAEARNAIDLDFVRKLEADVQACAGDPEIGAVLVTANGSTFTVGGDIDYMAARLDTLPDTLTELIGPFHRALLGIAELTVPVVCAAQGAVAGGGLGLLWAADVVLLAQGTKLATGFAAIGLSGDGGCTWYLPRLVGMRRAIQLQMGNRVLSAEEAVDWGLADRVVAPDRLAAEGEAAAEALAAGPTPAYAEMRRLIRSSFERDLAAGLDAERDGMIRTSGTDEARAGLTAFVERRQRPR